MLGDKASDPGSSGREGQGQTFLPEREVQARQGHGVLASGQGRALMMVPGELPGPTLPDYGRFTWTGIGGAWQAGGRGRALGQGPT